jgi:hypothetical protein
MTSCYCPRAGSHDYRCANAFSPFARTAPAATRSRPTGHSSTGYARSWELADVEILARPTAGPSPPTRPCSTPPPRSGTSTATTTR